MWDEEDGFFYDVLRLPDGHGVRSRSARWSGCCRSAPSRCTGSDVVDRLPRLRRATCARFNRNRPASRHQPDRDADRRRAAAACCRSSTRRLRRVLARMLDERSSSATYGIRSLSRCHDDAAVRLHGTAARVSRRLSAGRIDIGHVRRQLELARPDLDAGQRAVHSRAAAVLHATTATTSRSSVRPGRDSIMTLFEVAAGDHRAA